MNGLMDKIIDNKFKIGVNIHQGKSGFLFEVEDISSGQESNYVIRLTFDIEQLKHQRNILQMLRQGGKRQYGNSFNGPIPQLAQVGMFGIKN
tara:strand:+ start:202 stop:477 length:276 start_codon:yes stop_codon:yes gene_type:complete